ncbi:MAG: reverse transcriptase domain-containing protein, partial [Planctomycetota bacterium]
MKTWTGLFEEIASLENLWEAARRASLGRRRKPYVARFLLNLEDELTRLQEELRSRTYRPGPYSTFRVYEPKERLISAAPFRDRVVHHALVRVIEPLFERRFVFDSWANRLGKGTHRALERFQGFSRRFRYVLKGDIRKYFPSIDHEILKAKIRRVIRCPGTLWLLDAIIDASNTQDPVVEYFPGDDILTPLERRKGLPIGNLTSQFFANVYLDDLDHFVKDGLGVKAYLRYVDDFAAFSDDKRELGLLRER